METSQSMLSPTGLLQCQENLGSLCNEDEEILGEEDGYDDEYIQMLLDREVPNGGLQMQNSWALGARLQGIHYILRKREVFGFGFQTAFASVMFLDRFLARRSIDAEKCWAVRLLSMACLSLAAKMEENRVPLLPDFCVEDYYFESSVIQRMELLVLNTLDWKMGSITPFDFIHFFARKFCVPKNEISRSVDVILGAMRDGKIMCYKSSVIAAAATLVVLDQKGFTRNAIELKIGHAFEIENIMSCYDLFMNMERLKLSKDIESPGLSPIQLQPYGNSSAASAKRKRLVFDQNSEFDDEPHKKGI